MMIGKRYGGRENHMEWRYIEGLGICMNKILGGQAVREMSEFISANSEYLERFLSLKEKTRRDDSVLLRLECIGV